MDASLVSKTRIFRRNNKCIPRGRIRRGNILFNGTERGEGRIDSLSTWQGRRNFDEPAMKGSCIYIYIYRKKSSTSVGVDSVESQQVEKESYFCPRLPVSSDRWLSLGWRNIIFRP